MPAPLPCGRDRSERPRNQSQGRGKGGEVMKIKIRQDGSLIIDGKNKCCPFVPADIEFNENSPRNVRCGAWCALFSEPIKAPNFESDNIGVYINLCHNSIECLPADFTDERKQNETM